MALLTGPRAAFLIAARAILGSPEGAIPLATLYRKLGRRRAGALLRLRLVTVRYAGIGPRPCALAETFRRGHWGDAPLAVLRSPLHAYCAKRMDLSPFRLSFLSSLVGDVLWILGGASG